MPMFLVPVLFWRARKPTPVFRLPVVLRMSAAEPRAVLLLPVVLSPSAAGPTATLSFPVVLRLSAEEPLAVLPLPVVLPCSALRPLAVLWLPVVLPASAACPMAVLEFPMVLLKSASKPKAVLENAWTGPTMTTIGSAPVPPAVLPLSSLLVELQPGTRQTGWLQLGVLLSSRTSRATCATKRMIEFIESLRGPVIRRQNN